MIDSWMFKTPEYANFGALCRWRTLSPGRVGVSLSGRRRDESWRRVFVRKPRPGSVTGAHATSEGDILEHPRWDAYGLLCFIALLPGFDG